MGSSQELVAALQNFEVELIILKSEILSYVISCVAVSRIVLPCLHCCRVFAGDILFNGSEWTPADAVFLSSGRNVTISASGCVFLAYHNTELPHSEFFLLLKNRWHEEGDFSLGSVTQIY